ncbi:Clustered mitochondria [Nymphon striatum]|nr:Clustered mitochondria [Nymphon striatum]
MIRDFSEHQTTPVDGSTLSEALHCRGINIRYLGKVANSLQKVPQLEYAYEIAVSELICRSVKHLFTSYIQGVDMMNLSAAISHFLNCLLSSCVAPHSPLSPDELPTKNNKKKGRKKGKVNPLAIHDNNEWAMLSPKLFWTQIKTELKVYFDWTLESDSVDEMTEKYNIHKLSLLRQFCIKVGLQVLLREYHFDNKNKQTFYEEDVVNIFPVVKHINPRVSYLKEGYELISEALNLLNNVYGAMHPEIAQCLRMLARLNYLMGDHAEAMDLQQKAVFMSERVNGPDHPFTITEYLPLLLKLLYRARYLALLVCKENHPEVALLDSNIGLILHAVGEYDLSLRFLENALKLNIKYFSVKSLKVAVSYHLVARTQSCMGDFRGALQNEKETFSIYKQQLGEEHEKTKESSECLKHLTQQAVALQKKMNEIYKGTTGASLPPIQIQTLSMGSVLDMLNVINGVLFVQISQKDIENFKSEFERRQLKENSAITEEKESDESEEGGASR